MGARDWWEHDDVDPAQRTESTAPGLEAAQTDGAASTSAADEGASASADGQTVTPMSEPDQPTLEAAPGGSAGDASGPTIERGVYGADDPRRSPEEDPTLEDKAQVDLSDTAPDGTLLRQGLTDVHGVQISRSQDLGGGLPEGVAVPGSDRLSDLMDPFAAAEADRVAGAVGGRGGGVDPRLAGEWRTDAQVVDSGGVMRVVIPGVNDSPEQTAAAEKAAAENVAAERARAAERAAADKAAADKAARAAADKVAADKAAADKAAADKAAADKAAEEQVDDPPPAPPESAAMPAVDDDGMDTMPHVENAASLDPYFGIVDPAEDSGAQAVLVAGDAPLRRPAGGGYTDPPPPDVAQPTGGSNSDPLNRDPGYVDPAENTDDSGLPAPVSDPETSGGGGPPTDDVPGGPHGSRNAPTGGPAAQGGGTSASGGEPLSAPGAAASADPLGMEAGTAAPAAETTAGPAPQTEQTGAGVTLSAEPAWKVDGLAAINMETGQAAGPPDAALLVGGTEASGGLAMSPPSAESPLGPEPQPGQEGQEESAPGGPGEDDGMP